MCEKVDDQKASSLQIQRKIPDKHRKSGLNENPARPTQLDRATHQSQQVIAKEKALLHPYLIGKWMTRKHSPIQMHTVQ